MGAQSRTHGPLNWSVKVCRNGKRDRTQPADLSKANLHPVLFIQLHKPYEFENILEIQNRLFKIIIFVIIVYFVHLNETINTTIYLTYLR